MSQANRHRTVFVSNISYDRTEDELRALFSQVGTIASVRLPTDRDSGKRKGFGFVEYLDVEMALSAVRNLHEIDFHGRPLKVNMADQDTRGSAFGPADATQGRKRKGGGDDQTGVPSGGTGGAFGEPGVDPATEAGLEPVDPLSLAVERYDRRELFSALQGAKKLLVDRPAEAETFFTSQPALVRALHLAVDLLCGPHWPAGDEAATDQLQEAEPATEPAAPVTGAVSGPYSHLGRLQLPGVGFIIPGPEHTPLLDQV